MSVDVALLEVLQCPFCRGHLGERRSALTCAGCGKQFPVSHGIPDLTVFQSRTEQDDFNQVQASYEAELQDWEAQSRHMESLIRFYGTKTKLIVEGWADTLMRSSPMRVLDYGCGTGHLSRVLAQRFSPMFAFDISPVSVRENVADNGVLGCVANAFFLPFKDHVFDAVCVNGVLHHIVDLPDAVSEISRVARKFVFVSEVSEVILPTLRGLGRALAYPTLSRKLLYTLYILLWTGGYRIPRGLWRRMRACLSPKKRADGSHGSKYERPLDTATVEALFRDAGFVRKRLQYWTNLNYRGTGPAKRFVTAALVNDKIGTHFDLQLMRKE